jgi:phenylalanyl-tRNA synthetase alpha chain
MKDINEIKKEIASSKTIHELLNVKASLIGKSGTVTEEFKNMKDLSIEEKKAKGLELNQIKNEIEALVEARMQELRLDEINKTLESEKVDISTPSQFIEKGSLHPVSFVAREITDFFAQFGFSTHDGPEIEDDYHNFEALNFPALHPARNMHDTFYIKDSQDLLRTHTSSVQIRHMQAFQPPFRFLSIGKTYRCDSDRTHIPMFHQAEGVCVDIGISFAHLKTIVEDFLRHFFNGNGSMEIRFRSSFFPFTEPSFEVDINTGKGFLEVMGCGVIHPNVLKNCGIDAKYSGFAFGMGIERLAMLKYGIEDVRDCISSTPHWQKHYGF